MAGPGSAAGHSFAVQHGGLKRCGPGSGFGLQFLRDRRVALHTVQERCAEGGDEDRAGQRGAERGPEVGGGVLQAADRWAVLVGYRGQGHRAHVSWQATASGRVGRGRINQGEAP